MLNDVYHILIIVQAVVFLCLLFHPLIEHYLNKRVRYEIVKLMGYQTHYIHVVNSPISSWYTIPQATHDAEMVSKGFNSYLEAEQFMRDFIR